MLAPPISNDWTKHKEIQAAALKMPEVLTGQAHFTDDTTMDAIFMNSAERAVKEWEDAYWDVYYALDQYVYEMENEEEEYDDAEEDDGDADDGGRDGGDGVEAMGSDVRTTTV